MKGKGGEDVVVGRLIEQRIMHSWVEATRTATEKFDLSWFRASLPQVTFDYWPTKTQI